MDMKRGAYWGSTILVALVIGGGGAADLTLAEPIREAMTHLGYPLYFAHILGAWKVLGAIAILVPKLPRLKEWAYAGILFDVTGAAASHYASGDPAKDILVPFVILGLLVVSYTLRPESRRLPGPAL